MNAEPTDAQIDLACEVVIACLSGDAYEAARLIAAHVAKLQEEHGVTLKRVMLSATPRPPPPLPASPLIEITYTESVHLRAIVEHLHQAEADVDMLLGAIRNGLPKLQTSGLKPTNVPELVPFRKIESSTKIPEETVS